MALWTYLIFSIFHLIQGEYYCSYKSPDIRCVPCTNICSEKHAECGDDVYFCPKNCSAEYCVDICSKRCKRGLCEYIPRKTILRCAGGCEDGFAGRYCQNRCPDRCAACDQFEQTCTLCSSRYTGENCTEVTIISTSVTFNVNACPETCSTCNGTRGECMGCQLGYSGVNCEQNCTHCVDQICTVNGSCSTSVITAFNISSTTNSDLIEKIGPDPSKEPSDYTTVILALCGILFGLLLIMGAAVIIYKFNTRYRLSCSFVVSVRQSSNLNMDQSTDGYTYIDDGDLDTDYSKVKENKRRPRACPGNNQYESIGNRSILAEPDADSMSSLSTLSGSIFRNMLEIRNECDGNCGPYIADIEPSQQDTVHTECEEGYSNRYLTPTLPFFAAGSCTDEI